MTSKHRPIEKGDVQLINHVRSAPCLYDTKDPNFRLVYKKDEEWKSIAESLNMSELEARKRWTVLRDRYARELKQLALHPDSTEYGKNDFFRRMDFLRKYVKKREPKRKHSNSRDDEVEYRTTSSSLNLYKNEIQETRCPRPLKLYKVKYNGSNSESEDYQESQHGKSYITDDSQYSSNGKFSYNEQASEETFEQEDRHGNARTAEFQYYEEDNSAPYEVVDEGNETDMLESTNNTSRNIMENDEGSKSSFCIRTVAEDKISTLPQLQQRPIITSVCTQAVPPSPTVDMEEYFSKTIALYLRRLSPLYKIKAKVEIMQIIEKYIDLQESKS